CCGLLKGGGGCSLLALLQSFFLLLPRHYQNQSNHLSMASCVCLGNLPILRVAPQPVFSMASPVDVFICTADPEKEPTVGVMNTVLSAMAMDYPPEKLYVYLSDDGGAAVTLKGMREAWRFAKWWLPFCRRYGIKCRAPEAYFSAEEEDSDFGGSEFIQEREDIKVIQETSSDDAIQENETKNMPLLVYVSREKRPSHPHHFKVGALNVLLRVSGVISNSPYMLGLDCDMHCHDPSSARQAMCFHLDPKISPSLALVQFPQKFHNISNNDIYDSQLRSIFWVGFMYGSVLEDYFTGFRLHCKGWISVYCNPPRPQFLGSGITNLDEFLVQLTRWTSGLVDVAISKFCPLVYGPLKTYTFVQSMCYADLALFPIFYFLPLWCFATIPQLCLLNGIPLYPEVSNSYFIVFSFVFLSSISKHLYEVLSTGFTFRHWINEQRIWMMKSVTSHLYGSWDAFMKKIGMREASFFPTNKVDDVEQLKRYNMGVFDFQTSILFLAPMAALVILNMASFAVGISRVIFLGELDKFFIQVFIPFYVILMNYPIVEGMLIRKDRGRIPPSVTLLSAIISLIFYFLGSIIFI
ncbi:cellulose synthase like G1, partial [Prunus dulcis]